MPARLCQMNGGLYLVMKNEGTEEPWVLEEKALTLQKGHNNDVKSKKKQASEFPIFSYRQKRPKKPTATFALTILPIR
jgi:hypothetical protein